MSQISKIEPDLNHMPSGVEQVKLGQWYWVRADWHDDERKKATKRLCCVTTIGSNYVGFESVNNKSQYSSTVRIHMDNFDDECTFEPNARAVIAEWRSQSQEKIARLNGEIEEVTARLMISTGVRIGESSVGSGETQAVAVRGSGKEIEAYKADLVKTKEKTLPTLFEDLGKEHKILAALLQADLISLQAQTGDLYSLTKAIEKRILSVELYAGLSEQIVEIRSGEPAPLTEKVTLFQRRAYMDEECLANYEAGGMEFKDIPQFDEWIARPENLDRILPVKRGIIAFRVRRNVKDRVWNSITDFVRIMFERDADTYTYLYIRNGEQLFRMSTKIDFDEKLFPDLGTLDTTQPLYFDMYGSKAQHFISEGEYLQRLAQDEEHERLSEEKKCECYTRYPKSMSAWCHYSPKARGYRLLSQDTVYYDDAMKELNERIEAHNRVVLVLQGLLDRSPVLHPHPPWKIWTPSGFEAGLNLVFDYDRAITDGDKPDFEAYRARLNESLKVGCLTVGQDDAWLAVEREKECQRRLNNYRYRDWDEERIKWWNPSDPGPGTLARITHFTPKKRTCSYKWTRRRERRNYWADSDFVEKSFTCNASAVLNVDAYTPGDFKVFFNDPRTRAEYMQWAPLLLIAEDYHAGKRIEKWMPKTEV